MFHSLSPPTLHLLHSMEFMEIKRLAKFKGDVNMADNSQTVRCSKKAISVLIASGNRTDKFKDKLQLFQYLIIFFFSYSTSFNIEHK